MCVCARCVCVPVVCVCRVRVCLVCVFVPLCLVCRLSERAGARARARARRRCRLPWCVATRVTDGAAFPVWPEAAELRMGRIRRQDDGQFLMVDDENAQVKT